MTAFGMTAVFFGLFSAENVGIAGIPRGVDEGFWDSMWWALTYVLRLPALSAMYGATATVLIYAVTLSIFGLAVFGILVSLIDNAMRGRIERLREGHTPVKERGHLLLLGWNKKVVSVLRQLARLQPGARVAILATREVSEMSQTLRVAGIARERITVILRTGVPSNIDELERMAIDHASGVIILSNPADDSAAIKTLVILAAREHWPGKRPTLTAEIAEEQNYGLAEIAAKKRLHVVSTSRVTSKIIVQTIRNPGLARVYDELMSTDGNYIRAEHVQACIGKTVREIAYGFNDAIPIGITWEEDDDSGTAQHKAALNPEPDYDLAEGEHLVLLQRSGTARYAPRTAAYTSSVFNARTGTPVV
ncbi:MAG: hypothetical protein O7H39_16110, partial [Gammaproteobacteria bacterium]|nr:hypothetical protein [Gammaproteobacteria bacterium]